MHTKKHAIKAEVTTSDSTNSDVEDDSNFVAFVTSINVTNPLSDAFDVQKVTIDDNEDEQDKLLDSYNALLLKHIKYKKDDRKAIQSLDEKEHEISSLKKTLEERMS